MKFALNYSPQAVQLYQSDQIQVDLFKCPAWPDLIAKAGNIGPAYVHFPLRVGDGSGHPIDIETGRPAAWAWIERLVQQSETRHINLHLHPPHRPEVLPDKGHGPTAAIETTQRLIRDVEAVVKRFGADRVVVENGYNLDQRPLHPAYFPDVVSKVVDATGCGLLFNLSHARMAANVLDVAAASYIAQLPLHATRELHLTGIQYVGDYWIRRMQREGVDSTIIESCSHRLMDHLPLLDDDWEFMTWAISEIRAGAWRIPDIVALECGGVGPFWQATCNDEALAEQVPRLYSLFNVLQ